MPDASPSFPAWASALAVAATLICWIVLARRRRVWLSGGFPSRAPALAIPAYDLAAFLAVLCIAAGVLRGFWPHALALAGVMLLVSRTGISPARHFGAGPLSLRAVALGSFLVVGAVYLPLQMAAGGITLLFKHLGWPTPPEPAVALFLRTAGWREFLPLVGAAVVLAPLAEEGFFRGFLQPVLKCRLGMTLPHAGRAAWIITALLFAGLHDSATVFLPLFLFGLVLGFVYEATGSLLLCIGIHFCFNALTVILLLLGYDTAS